jgi:hypothetical protein
MYICVVHGMKSIGHDGVNWFALNSYIAFVLRLMYLLFQRHHVGG